MEKDVVIYSGFIVIQNRDRRYSRRFEQLTPSSEARLRAIAAKLRPVPAKRQPVKSTSRKSRPYSSKRRPSAAEGLRLLTHQAMANLVSRVNNPQEDYCETQS